MEEILASIRRIIADEGPLPEPPAPRNRPSASQGASLGPDMRRAETPSAPLPSAAARPVPDARAAQPRAEVPPPFARRQSAAAFEPLEPAFEPELPPVTRGRPGGRLPPARMEDEEHVDAPMRELPPEPAAQVYGMRPAEPPMVERRRWEAAASPRPPVERVPERDVRPDVAPRMAARPVEPERLRERERVPQSERFPEPQPAVRSQGADPRAEARFGSEPAYRSGARTAGSLPPVRPAATPRPALDASTRPAAAAARGNVEAFERSLAEARSALRESELPLRPAPVKAPPAETPASESLQPPVASTTPQPTEPRAPLPRRDLLSPAVDAAVAAAFQSLGDLVLPQHERTVEDLVKEILRPMLKEWLNQNLAGIVERLVRAEIERVTANLR